MKQWRVGCIAVATLCTLSACATARAAPRESARHLAAAVVLSPALDAPPLALPNYDGTPVTPARLRGAVLLVTFTYTHCRTVCPLIVARLRALRQELGSTARNVQLIAVSSDPQGDTPEAVGQFLAAHDMTGRMLYLVGSRAALGATWRMWHVDVAAQGQRLVDHTAAVFAVSAAGKLAAIYGPDFQPPDIAHDIPLLMRT